VNLSGRRVLVTGASRGIGAALVRACAEAGAQVALVARTEDAIDKLAADVGGEAYAVDLCDRNAVEGLYDRIERDGVIDVLVNNAGADHAGRFADLRPDALADLVQLNLVTPMELCRQALQRMLARSRGHIVNVSSLGAMIPFPGLTAYGASKAGLSRFTVGLQGELRGTGVGTTLVEVGGVRTDMVEHTRTYGPTRRSWRRFEALRLSVDIDADVLAHRIVRAVERGRPAVYLPRRAIAYPLLGHAPAYITNTLLTGVDRHTDQPGYHHQGGTP
jgi:short-subunit dehydrogenase